MASVSGAAMAATGGTIEFMGAIVAPPYAITAAPTAATSRAASSFTQSVPDAQAVTFTPAPNAPAYAKVSVMPAQPSDNIQDALAARALVARFSDGAGRQLKPDQNGEYRLGGSGGTLLLNTLQSQTAAVVVTSYE